jgi:hypothetical protein
MFSIGQILILMGFGFCFFVLGLLLWRRLDNRRMKSKAQYELQMKLLDKAASAQEGQAILQTHFQNFSWIQDKGGHLDLFSQLKIRYLNAVQAGILLLIFSAGILFLSNYASNSRGWFLFGGVFLFLGPGLLISTGLSYWMAKRMDFGDSSTPGSKVGK